MYANHRKNKTLKAPFFASGLRKNKIGKMRRTWWLKYNQQFATLDVGVGFNLSYVAD